MLVIFVFLQSWRATLIPALTMPVSLIGAFAFVNLLDFSINTLTLFAVVLATGIVVDDAIVVIENIERHIQSGRARSKPPRMRCERSSGRSLPPHSCSSRCSCLSHFFPGTTGRLYQQFALDCICRRHFRVQRLDADAGAVGSSAQTRGARPGTNLWRHRGSDQRGNPVVCRRGRGIGACAVGGCGGLCCPAWRHVLVYQRVPQAFLPEQDAGWFMTLVQAPAGASLDYTSNALRVPRKS